MRPFGRQTSNVLVGEVGHDQISFGLHGASLTRVRSWPTDQTPGLRAAFTHYQREVGAALPDAACVAVAGPVDGSRARLASSAWVGAEDELPFPTRLVNHLDACAIGIPLLAEADRVALGGEAPDPQGRVCVVDIGASFGAALKVGRTVLRGDMGQADLTPANADQDALLRWLRQRHSGAAVPWSSVLSGPGLGTLLSYVRRRVDVSRPVRKALRAPGASPERVVVEWWSRDAACAQAAAMLVGLSAVAIRGLVLQAAVSGGVYISGSLPVWFSGLYTDAAVFRETFDVGGQIQPLLSRVPIQLVTHDHLALLGASVIGRGMLAG